MKNKPYSHFVWIDMKTTGENPSIDTIEEVSLKVTDGDMNALDYEEFHSVVEGNMIEVEKEMIKYLSKVLPEGVKPPIAGYNVSEKERPFIEIQLKEFKANSVHYRNLDVSSIEMVSKNIYPGLKLPKKMEEKAGLELMNSAIHNMRFLKDKIFREEVAKVEEKTSSYKAKKTETPYLIWTDLETTGLESKNHKIIEIATIITDGNLDIIDNNSFQEIIKIDQDVVDNGGEMAIKMHRENGLLERCLNADESKTIENAEEKMISFLRSIIPEGVKAPLAGNSIGSLDKPFIKEQMPKLNETSLTRANLDVTSFTMIAKNFVNGLEMPRKTRNHLAMQDIEESINELRFIKEKALKPVDKVMRKNKQSLRN